LRVASRCLEDAWRLPPPGDDASLGGWRCLGEEISEFAVAVRRETKAASDPGERLVPGLADYLIVALPPFLSDVVAEFGEDGDAVVDGCWAGWSRPERPFRYGASQPTGCAAVSSTMTRCRAW
jgi:hypothetical protein